MGGLGGEDRNVVNVTEQDVSDIVKMEGKDSHRRAHVEREKSQ